MKAKLLALFVALLMVGCGESSTSSDPADPVDPLDSLKATDFDDPETVDKILAEATLILEYREKNGETLSYGVDEQTPYSGWEKTMHSNGEVKALLQYKDGKPDGLSFYWHRNGQKEKELNFKDGKLMSAVAWKDNGDECFETKVEEGNGFVGWTRARSGKFSVTYKDGEPVEE